MAFVELETEETPLYERVGGAPFFTALVDDFYAGVAEDPVLRPLYPAELAPSRRHLALFLMQYWGGPRTYGEERGHPRLRMRHVPFTIGEAERAAWLRHMTAAVDRSHAAEPDRQQLHEYFTRAAASLVNSFS
jgi:hemoglobin